MRKGGPLTAFLLVAIALSLPFLGPVAAGLRIAGNDQGYAPVQPIAFSHRLHAGELEIACLYCHSGAEKSRHAGVPALSVCMNCHRSVSAPFSQVRAEAEAAEKEKRAPRPVVSPEIAKIYRALGLDAALQRDPALTPSSVAWSRVHNLPDFVAFDHRPHVAAGVECAKCHGPVDAMERLSQGSTLTMGWCVSCHRGSTDPFAPGAKPRHVSTDCSRCHY